MLVSGSTQPFYLDIQSNISGGQIVYGDDTYHYISDTGLYVKVYGTTDDERNNNFKFSVNGQFEQFSNGVKTTGTYTLYSTQ